MRFDILTIFPKIFSASTGGRSSSGGKGGSASGGDSSCYFNYSILKRAQERKLITIKTYNLRDFTTDRHHKVDDSPYGGGPGMVFKVEPIYKAVSSILRNPKSEIRNSKQIPNSKKTKSKTRVILFSTRGKKFDAKTAKRLAKYDQLILICGRYEGVDERVAQYIADEEISMGDYILSGGELPAMVLVEAVSRFIPGVLGKHESLEEIKGSYPVYTRPEVFATRKMGHGKRKMAWRVPNMLLTGDHKKIEEWRKNQQEA